MQDEVKMLRKIVMNGDQRHYLAIFFMHRRLERDMIKPKSLGENLTDSMSFVNTFCWYLLKLKVSRSK